MQKQVELRARQQRQQCTTFDSVFAQEFSKGEMAGMEMVLRLPHLMVETRTGDIEDVESED